MVAISQGGGYLRVGDISGWGISQGGGYLRVGEDLQQEGGYISGWGISQGGGYLRVGDISGWGRTCSNKVAISQESSTATELIPHTVYPRHNHTHRTHPQTTLCLTWITCGCASRICPAPCWLEYTDILARVVPTMILGPCGPGQAKRLVASAVSGVEDMCPVCREGRWRE